MATRTYAQRLAAARWSIEVDTPEDWTPDVLCGGAQCLECGGDLEPGAFAWRMADDGAICQRCAGLTDEERLARVQPWAIQWDDAAMEGRCRACGQVWAGSVEHEIHMRGCPASYVLASAGGED